jgi:cytochrome c2
LRDDALWAIVAYVQVMPYESPRTYRDELRAAEQSESAPYGTPVTPEQTVTNGESAVGDGDRGRHLFRQYACIVCHEIPGVVGASIPVGPPLDGMGMRIFIAGVVQNTPENMVRWLRTPEQFVPDGAMPNLGVSERDAQDMAAYLGTLR